MATDSPHSSYSIRFPTDILGADEIQVIHVDDEPGFSELVADYLEREDPRFDVTSAISASAGLEALEAAPFDCIVSDYEMPDMNGIEFLNAVRADYPDLPFILYTGKGSETVASEAISAGVSDYLQKEAGTDQYTVLANRIEHLVAGHRAEQLVERAFEAMDWSREGIALLDEAGEFIYVNERYCEIVGYQPDELIGAFWELVYPEEQAQRIKDTILESVPEQGRWTGETVYKRKDGSRVAVNHALAHSEKDTMICLIRDLSDSEGHQWALQAERKRFDLFVDAVADYAIFMLDPAGFVTSWNSGAERIKGYGEDVILGEHFSTFYTEAQQDAGLPDRLLTAALESGSVTHRGPRVRKDGSTFPAEVVITAVYNEDGGHRGFGKVTRDLSEQKEALE